jgi:hypothetical protein
MRGKTPTRNLLIVQTEPEQGPADWIAIREIIERKAPDIEVRIAVNGQSNSTIIRWQEKRPSLLFSPVILSGFSPRGGSVYCGRLFGKAEQLRRLSSIGISTPKSAEFYRQRSFTPDQ